MEESRVVEIFKLHLRQMDEVVDVQTEQKIIEDGLVTDLMSFDDSDILHLVECKGTVSIGELAKGLGQCYQYYHQKDENPKSIEAEVFFVCPRDVESVLSRLYIHEFVFVFLIESDGRVVEYIPTQGNRSSSIQIPGTFYIEGFELKYVEWAIISIMRLSSSMETTLTRKQIEEEILKEGESREGNNTLSNHRNTLITLKSLNIIDSMNLLTPYGYKLYGMLRKDRNIFQEEIIRCFHPFLLNLQNALIEISKDKDNDLKEITCTQKEISDKVCDIYNGKVRYFSNTRRISTIIKIAKELDILESVNRGKYHLKKLIGPHLPPPNF